MSVTRQDRIPSRSQALAPPPEHEPRGRKADPPATPDPARAPGDGSTFADTVSPVRKAAIVLVSLDQSVASQLLSHLDRAAVEAVTWEIARLDRVDSEERAAVLDEFYQLGLRRLCFVFDDLVKMNDADIRAACHDEDLETWALALAGASPSIRTKVLAALPAIAASRLRHSLEQLGPFRLSESESAQLEITERMRRLYDHGRIALPEPDGREEVLV